MMKLAEALLERSSLQKKIQELKQRAEASARYQEGEQPAENLNDIMREAEGAFSRLETLIRQINITNSATVVGANGTTMTGALAKRDTLKSKHAFLTGTAEALTGGTGMRGYLRTIRSELKFEMQLPPAGVRLQADELAREIRELDANIQQVGWATDLIE